MLNAENVPQVLMFDVCHRLVQRVNGVASGSGSIKQFALENHFKCESNRNGLYRNLRCFQLGLER